MLAITQQGKFARLEWEQRCVRFFAPDAEDRRCLPIFGDDVDVFFCGWRDEPEVLHSVLRTPCVGAADDTLDLLFVCCVWIVRDTTWCLRWR